MNTHDSNRINFNLLRRGYTTMQTRMALLLLGVVIAVGAVVSRADGTAGLDSRASFPAYLTGALPTAASLPTTTSSPMPVLLSEAGVFSNTANRIPHAGFIPYELNSPLWTDGADKSRFVGVPFDSSQPNNPALSPKIGFSPTGNWTFPNGTVIIKNFDMRIDERSGASDPVRRLETRILIRNADGTIRGATYRWAPPVNGNYADATLVSSRQNEDLTITQADGSTRMQSYTYPSPGDCTTCHNAGAGLVLGIRTAQLNGAITYPATGRTANQLHTLNQLGMFNVTLADPATYDEAVDIGDTSATFEHRVRSYLSSNCSHCHMPENIGPIYDMRFETPSEQTGIFGAPFNGLVRGDLPMSRLYVRDAALPGNFPGPMPPIARNVPDQRVLDVYNQWVNYGYTVTSVSALAPNQVRVQFDRAVEPASAAVAANYVINGVPVSQASPGPEPGVVMLTTASNLAYSSSYELVVNRVRESASPQNPIFPNTRVAFNTPAPPTAPGAPSITMTAIGNGQVTLSYSVPAADGGAPITGYVASCTPGPFAANSTGLSVTVNGLTNGTSYSCTVAAVNSVGTGTPSPAVNVTPARVPDAPTNLVATPGNGSVSITFDAPANNGGAVINSYTVSCVGPATVTASAAAAPVTVTGLTNGVLYQCTAAATNAAGTGADSAPVGVTPAAPPLALVSIASRKLHGPAGSFDLDLRPVSDIAGPISVEPRAIGSGHRIVFTFNVPVTATGSVTVLDAALLPAGTVSNISSSGSSLIVELTGVQDGSRARIALSGVNNDPQTFAVAIGFLIGDVNSSRHINASDVSSVRLRAGQTVDGINFRHDLNASGEISAADVLAVKVRLDRQIP